MSQPQAYQPGPQNRGLFTDLYDRVSEKIDDVVNNRPSDESSNLGDAFTMDNIRRTFNLDNNTQVDDNARFADLRPSNDSQLNDSRFADLRPSNDSRFDNNDDFSGRSFMRGGRRCRIVCDPPRNQGGIERISRRLLGLSLRQARQIYNNIRVVEVNGRRVPTTQDYDRTRINVATRDDVVIRIDGFY
uniref:Uncharacterized protein n=1 Tax=viral metagenome TaxID=1070528 RepID=A0A6C0C8H5_9ZZZZ